MDTRETIKMRIDYAQESRNAAQFKAIRKVEKFAERLAEEAASARTETPGQALKRLSHAVTWGVANLDLDETSATVLRWTERLALALGEFAEVDSGIKDE